MKWIIFLIAILAMSLVSAADFTPQGNINLRDYYNITNVPEYDGTNINITGFYYGNASQLTDLIESDPFWTGNQSSYYLVSNPFGFYNSTDFSISNYYLLNNPYGYYNSTDFSISDYFTKSNILGFSYYNATNFDINDYYLENNPFSFVNITTASNLNNLVTIQGENITGGTINNARISLVESEIPSLTSSWAGTLDAERITDVTDLNNLLTLDWANITNKFITAVADVYINMVGTTATFNETKLNSTIDLRTASTTYNATSIATIEGTLDAGNLTSVQAIDDDWYNVSEDAGGSPLLININFTGVTSFSNILLRERYSGGLGHEIEIQSWNYDDSAWETHTGDITDQSTMVEHVIFVLDSSSHISGGLVQVRLDHQQNGVSTHDFFLDYIALQEGFTSITSADHDGLLGRDDILNHPWALPTNGSLRNATNVVVTNNVTASWFLGNINASDVQNSVWLTSYTETDPYWTGNQSSYSTTSTIIGWGYYNATDFSISDYYTKTQINDFAYYNATDFDIADYSTTATIHGWGFYNSTTSSTGSGDLVFATSPTFVTGIAVPANSISDEELDEGGTFDWTGAHTWAASGTFNDDLIFADEIKPDGTLCDNNDILFKTAGDDWDCKTVIEAGAGDMNDLHDDTSPQLGGYLDADGEDIGSTSDEIENIYVGVNTRIYFGDGQEASIYYNGTVLIIG